MLHVRMIRNMRIHKNLGNWTEEELDTCIADASGIAEPGKRIAFISERFLDTPYREGTLTGDMNQPEVLVMNLREVDCFTLIDYVEAMSLSRSVDDFEAKLRVLRYRSGVVDYHHRNHFFSDWPYTNRVFIADITKDICGDDCETVMKLLNNKGDGTYLIPGIPCSERQLVYISPKSITYSVSRNINTGDFAGVYSEQPGLDVSHVGILVRHGHAIYFRHASHDRGKVVDDDFTDYMTGKPGLVIYRSRK